MTFPLARQHNWLIFSILVPAIRRCLQSYATGHLVDIGCGIKPYSEIARPYVTLHTGIDHQESLHDMANADLIGSAYSIPLDSASYDTALCTCVLEHLEEPQKALSETFRVLKSGGYAIYSVPLFWHIHEAPRDFYRYTRHGIRYLFEASGFELIEITALSGFTITFGQELVYFLYRLRKGGVLNPLWWIVPPIGHLIQAFSYLVGKVEKAEAFTIEYVVVARKP